MAVDIGALRDEHALLWAQMPSATPCIGPRRGRLARFFTARAARRLIDEIAGEIERLPDGADERLDWRGRVRGRVERFGDERLGWPDGYRRLMFGDDFYSSSVEFVRRARAFCPRLSLAELGQALRNVWIGNCLQVLLDRPVVLRQGLFAYSMLYPLTDNWLDDRDVSAEAKREFGRRFGRRLGGAAALPRNAREAELFALVGQIEEELPRASFPRVYDSLGAIHEAQSRSLLQHDAARLTDDELLAISVTKGGSSVLADLHLVAGRPGPAEERFAFGYGVFLQLLDDLQDVDEDLAAGHETLFTRAAARGLLDAPAARLLALIDRVLDGNDVLSGPALDERKDLVRRNCRALLVGSVAEQERRFSRRFRRELEARCAVSLRAHRRLRRRALRRWVRIAARHGEDALASFLDGAAPAAVARHPGAPVGTAPPAPPPSVCSRGPRALAAAGTAWADGRVSG